MKKALNYIISSIVSEPSKVKIKEENSEDLTTFTISVDKNDMGRIIGKEGRIIRAIRNVIKIPAIKSGKKINIDLLDTLD